MGEMSLKIVVFRKEEKVKNTIGNGTKRQQQEGKPQ